MKNQCKDIGKISGIYKIIHKKSGKYYVGSSMNINIGTNSRLNTHLRYLKSNRHRNDYLQNAWNKYGKTAFEFKIVEIIEPIKEKLLMTEQKYLDIAKNEKNNTYNLCFSASGGELSEYSKIKKSNSLKKTYEKNPSLIENHKKFMKMYFSNPKNKEYLHTESYKKKLRTGQRNRFADEFKKQKHLEAMNRIDVKNKISKGVLDWHKNNPDKKNIISEKKSDKTIRKLVNSTSSEIFVGTVREFKKFNYLKSSVWNLIKGRNKSFRNWSLYKD